MDFNMKQWREQQQHESEDQQQEAAAAAAPSAKLPRLLHLEQHSSASALPLFVTEPTTNKLSTNLSPYPPDSTPTHTKFSRIGSYFSLGQWQELELQALIYRHMLAGAAVPPELLHLVKKSLLNSSHPYYLPHHPLQSYPHLQSAASMQSGGYWGRGGMDPEPGRCRRTDGKKWRCSRDVVAGQKYCERHMHRGRNRSRKPVEIPTTPSTNYSGTAGMLKANNSIAAASQPIVAAAMAGGGGGSSGGSHFAFSGPSPSIDLFHLSHRSSESIVETQNDVSRNEKSSGQTLRHFFDDWPRSMQESENAGSSASTVTMTDFSLKLSTGDGPDSNPQARNIERERGHSNWNSSWETNQVASMGGPLAEALRSSTSNSSPTSVLHQLQRASASEASYITT